MSPEPRSLATIVADVNALLRRNAHGLLSTLSVREEGYPFGSVVDYAVSPDSRVFFQMSPLAEHFRNAERHPKASLCVWDSPGTILGDQAKATFLLSVRVIADASQELGDASYLHSLHEGVPEEVRSTFRVVEGTIQKVRWIGGFGEARWISAPELQGTTKAV